MKPIQRTLLSVSSCLLAGSLAQAAATPPAPPAKPPVAMSAESTAWTSHDTTVRLSYLPRRYSCDELADRFRDLLTALGARAEDMSIRPYECENGGESYSPRVRLKFSTPSVLTNMRVESDEPKPRTLRLAPGSLGSWTRNDCELMRQTKDQLLPQLTPKIVGFSLACAAAPINSEHYSITVQAVDPRNSPSRMASAQ